MCTLHRHHAASGGFTGLCPPPGDLPWVELISLLQVVSHIHTACVGLKAEDEETGAQAPASACTAAQPHPPPGLPPTLLPETVEDPKRALVHALQNDLSRMSVLLERLDELLSA